MTVGPPRGVGAVVVGQEVRRRAGRFVAPLDAAQRRAGLDQPGPGVGDHSEAPVHRLAEGVVEHAGAVARHERLDRLREQDAASRPRVFLRALLRVGERPELAERQQALVQPGELAHGPPAVAARRGARHVQLLVPGVRRVRDDLRVPVRGEAVGGEVAAPAFDRHADPAVVHPQRQEDLLAHEVWEGPAADAAHHLAEHEPGGAGVVAGLLARLPARLAPHRADARDGLLPLRLGPPHLQRAKAAGVGERVAKRDALLAARAELGHVAGDPIVELEPPALPQLRDGDRGHGLAAG